MRLPFSAPVRPDPVFPRTVPWRQTLLRHVWLLVPLTAGAAPAMPVEAPPTAPVAARSAARAPVAAAPAVTAKSGHVVVIEDDNVRIEEVRSRGRVQSIHVQSKLGNVRGYDIQVAPAGRDPSQERGNAGQRTWSLLSF